MAFFSACIGVVALVRAMIGYLIRPANIVERILLFAVALALIDSLFTTDLIGYALFSITFLLQKFWIWRPQEAFSVRQLAKE